MSRPHGRSVILAGILLKMGTYGFLGSRCRSSRGGPRFAGEHAIVVLSLIGIIYARWSRWCSPISRTDRLLLGEATGVVMLGIWALNAAKMPGAIIIMINTESGCTIATSAP